MPADTYVEPHWFTGKPKTRCVDCGKVVFETLELAEARALQISERQPMMAYLGPTCGHYHVSRKKRRRY